MLPKSIFDGEEPISSLFSADNVLVGEAGLETRTHRYRVDRSDCSHGFLEVIEVPKLPESL